jgi:glycosyltransferase involved in cell wall biosynthesis
MAAYQRLTAPPPLVLMGPVTTDTPTEYPPGVTVLHSVPHATVMAAWERALFGVAPSILPEPFGNVVHEAMSKGKAMIGTAPSGMTDMIADGKTGLLVPPGDVGTLARAMQRLIDDGALRERLGRAARERAQLFTADAVMPRFEELYQELADMNMKIAR